MLRSCKSHSSDTAAGGRLYFLKAPQNSSGAKSCALLVSAARPRLLAENEV